MNLPLREVSALRPNFGTCAYPHLESLNIDWPPKSPSAALAASPSGRKRIEKYYQHRPSQSPTRRRSRSPNAEAFPAEETDDEDEETLQLQLQAIEAKLKLKNLQKERRERDPGNGEPVASVQVPSSPKRNAPQRPLPQSPRRIQLGIDKGLKAADISLKHVKENLSARTGARVRSQDRTKPNEQKCKSYAERLVATRGHDRQREDKQQRSRAEQSRSFGVRKVSDHSQKENNSPDSVLNKDATAASDHENSAKLNQCLSTAYDKHSGFELSKRLLECSVLDEALQEKEIYSIPHLLKEVTAPQYDPSDVPGDYVVFGIIASKSKPRDHAQTPKTSSENDTHRQRSKFMVLRLTDLEWEVDLFLFGDGFETFWKLTVGTVIAVLNPGIMPPKPHMRDTGKFSMKLGSSEDTVLEVGTAADLAFCKSVKSDGQLCGTWVDKRKTEYCEFHVGLQVARSKSSRMEINTMGSFNLFEKTSDARKGRGKGRGGSSRNPFGSGRQQKDQKPKTTMQGQYYDREAHSAAYSLPSSMPRGASAAKLLDADDYGPGAELSAAERNRKRLAAREKERDLAKALDREGSGPGVEYLRSKHDGDQDSQNLGQRQSAREGNSKNAASFGLVRSKSDALSFDPMSGRRSKKDAVGWGKAFKRGLSPTATARSPSPKKARFVVEGKGTRAPGAESLSSQKKQRHETQDDADDDLELV